MTTAEVVLLNLVWTKKKMFSLTIVTLYKSFVFDLAFDCKKKNYLFILCTGNFIDFRYNELLKWNQ